MFNSFMFWFGYIKAMALCSITLHIVLFRHRMILDGLPPKKYYQEFP